MESSMDELEQLKVIFPMLERALLGEPVKDWIGPTILAIADEGSMLVWYETYLWMVGLSPDTSTRFAINQNLSRLRGEYPAVLLSLQHGTAIRAQDPRGINNAKFVLEDGDHRQFPLKMKLTQLGRPSKLTKVGDRLRVETRETATRVVSY